MKCCIALARVPYELYLLLASTVAALAINLFTAQVTADTKGLGPSILAWLLCSLALALLGVLLSPLRDSITLGVASGYPREALVSQFFFSPKTRVSAVGLSLAAILAAGFALYCLPATGSLGH